jgi:hypothetical protein
MDTVNSISEFNHLPLPERFNFFEGGIEDFITSATDQELYQFLRAIILDLSENENIRKIALSIFTNCVFLERIKVRQALNVLLDEWTTHVDKQHLEAQRLKDLFYYYEEDREGIEKTYKSFTENADAELVSEAYLCLGLISFQKGLVDQSDSTALMFFNECNLFLKNSLVVIENRVDAEFFHKASSIIANLINQSAVSSEEEIKSLASILFSIEANSFHFVPNAFYLSIYNTLVRLSNIKKAGTSSWLDMRAGLTNLFSEYSLLQNKILKDRLYQSRISKIFVSAIATRFVEPFFVLNLQADIARIDARLAEFENDNDEKRFLQWLRGLISDSDRKKKVELNDLKGTLSKIFPYRKEADITESISKISNLNDATSILNAYYDLAKPSIQDLIDKLISACLKLQGTLIYRNASEDNRNSHIANLLEASGYLCKDQTRWGKSATGKLPGEIDILISDLKQFPVAIIEALNLESLKQDYIILHLDKLFNYDSAGHPLNFILIYSEARKFSDLWEKYKVFAQGHNYAYRLLNLNEIDGYEYASLRLAFSTHLREEKETLLYHVMIDMKN